MKIEIELSEVEHLRNQVKESKKRTDELEAKLKELSESELKQKAVALSWRLFDNYMSAVFERLGFDTENMEAVICHDNVEHWLGKTWWNSDRIRFELEATVTARFKHAFLKIGIMPQDKVEKKDDYEL